MRGVGVLLAATCVLRAAAARAQVQAPVSLTIEQAVAEAVEHNLAVIAERYNITVADARVLTASLRPNPVVTASVMLPDTTIFNSNVNPREGIVRGDVLLERGGKRERRIEVAEDVRSVAVLQLQNTIRMLTLSVQTAFVDLHQAQADLRLARESLAAFNDIVSINTERVRTGDLASVELVRSRLAALQFQNDVSSRATKLAVAQQRLRALLGRLDATPIEAVGELRREGLPPRLDALQVEALQLRPDLKALERDQVRAAADVRLQLAQGKVDYTVSAEFHRQLAPGSLTGNEWGLFFSAPIPLFNRNQGEIARAREETRQAAARISALQSDITSRPARRVATRLHLGARLVETIEQQMLAQARDVRDTIAYSYRRGEASFVELIDAQRTLNDTHAELQRGTRRLCAQPLHRSTP